MAIAPSDLKCVIGACAHPHSNHTAIGIDHRAAVRSTEVEVFQVIVCRSRDDRPTLIPIVWRTIVAAEHIAGKRQLQLVVEELARALHSVLPLEKAAEGLLDSSQHSRGICLVIIHIPIIDYPDIAKSGHIKRLIDYERVIANGVKRIIWHERWIAGIAHQRIGLDDRCAPKAGRRYRFMIVEVQAKRVLFIKGILYRQICPWRRCIFHSRSVLRPVPIKANAQSTMQFIICVTVAYARAKPQRLCLVGDGRRSGVPGFVEQEATLTHSFQRPGLAKGMHKGNIAGCLV